jgi:4-amino-4-deoxy-L-arabinose transferase-like glycosyltransferase
MLAYDSVLDRWFWPAIIAIAMLLAAVQVISVRQESQTWDEGLELTGGYVYLATGKYRVALEQPPLQRMIAALPLLALHPDLDQQTLAARNMATVDLRAADRFMYYNRVSPERMLFAARAVMIAVNLALVFALAAWCRAKFGAPAGVLAALFLMLDPTVIAHGRYVKNDMMAALTVFLAVIAWEWFLERQKRTALIAAGVALGAAIGTKFSALFLIPVFAILYVVHEGRGVSFRRFVFAGAAAGGIAVTVLLLLYAPYIGDFIPGTPDHDPARPSLANAMSNTQHLAVAVAWAGEKLGWRAHPLLVGLANFVGHAAGGHVGYLAGRQSATGWWYYFPAAFAVKTPLATLAGLLIAAIAAIAGRAWKRIARARFAFYTAAIPLALYAAISVSTSVTIGLRHLLPIYPFLFALLAAALTKLPQRVRVAAIIVVSIGLAIESFAAFPYYTAFFNAAVGGPGNGPRYLVDSNLDWGQDAKRLAEYMQEHHKQAVCICYFGTAPLWHFDINALNIPDLKTDDAPLLCDTLAVSATPLYGVYASPPDLYAWLRDVPPEAKVGWSIYLWSTSDPGFQAALAKLRRAR